VKIFESARFKKEKIFAKKKRPDLYKRIDRAINMIISGKFTNGSNYEKLEPKHENIYSIRINECDRLVFKRENDEVYLLYFISHYGDN
jgi:Txe/YoeB family toxin of Txe-Axe toxin-antitoxin module